MLRKILVTVGLTLLWALGVIAVVSAEAIWFAAPAVQRGDVASIETHLVNELREAAAERRVGSAALVLVHGGEIVAEHGFGVADTESQTPVSTDRTLFIVGSVSKAVTAWGVMKLVEDRKLGLDEPVMPHLTRWRFPGSEAHRDRVTARHLLSHTAGIDEGFGLTGVEPAGALQTLEEWLTQHGVVVVREPGTMMSYSSAGYGVLQLLIEEITGQTFAEYMKQAVLLPLGMTHSSFDLDALVAEGRAQELTTNYDGDLNPTPHRRYAVQAAVSLRTTARDLGRFVVAHTRDSPVLRAETLKQLVTPQRGTGRSWGLGETLYVADESGGQIVGHDGGVFPASGASIRVNRATGDGFVLLVSGSRGATNQLVHDWTYWETGLITSEARRQVVQNRAATALWTMILGAIALVAWRLRPVRPTRR